MIMSAMTENEQTLKRFKELSIRAERSGSFVYTSFHSPSGAALAYQVAAETQIKLFGGIEGCERVVVRFGDPEQMGYEEDFPIAILNIKAKQEKFAEELGHRDYLGAIMNLGLERDVLGDIIVVDKTAYVFVLEEMADYIAANLEKVRHTPVKCLRCSTVPDVLRREPEVVVVTMNSLRLDSIIARIWHLSRGDSKDLFVTDKVFRNGRTCTSPEVSPQEGDTITVRGFGRFDFVQINGETKKGKLSVAVKKY